MMENLAKRLGHEPKDIEEIASECNESVEQVLYNQSMALVFKEYLPHIAKEYEVIPFDGSFEPNDAVMSFDVTKLVVEHREDMVERLKNVYHLLAYSGDSLAVIMRRTCDSTKVSLAVGVGENAPERARVAAASVRDALLGNFPGTECSDVALHSEEYGKAFFPLNQAAGFGLGGFQSVGVVSNIATEFSEKFVNQGIEKLIDGIRPAPGKSYTVILLGHAAESRMIELRKESLAGVYSGLSPFAKHSKNWGVNENKNWSNSVNLGIFASHSAGLNAGVNAGANAGVSKTNTIGGNLNLGHSWGGSVGSSEGITREFTDYAISHMLQTIDKQMARLEQGEALGLWNFAAYVLSEDSELVREVSHAYMALTQGRESYFEKPAVNIWDAHEGGGMHREDILKVRDYLTRLEHPVFGRKSRDAGELLNSWHWPDVVNCTTGVTGEELSRALSLPRTSIPGLPVIECAAFGREVSAYGNIAKGDVKMGRIHHMHHDEETPVMLSSESLTSHVFVTGSTGCGKSNTVYKLLEEAGTDFLVIEPAKGEYKYELGSDVNYFGTNYMMGEILRINPFVFPEGIHVFEHIDRLLEVFNVCWPMYAAMPAVLKEAVIRAYERCGWDLKWSRNERGALYPTFADVCDEIDSVIESSDYSDENKGNYRGSLKTRLESLTNGINGLIFCEGCVSDEALFDSKAIVDLSRVGSSENKSLIMGILIIKLQEHRMAGRGAAANEGLRHITVLEEAHNLLRNGATSGSVEGGGGMAAKSVEMLANAIAEMRTYGEAFVIVDQAPGLLDMSAIRNTNTKVIMRLPDQSDRELVGRAANLNDEQIAELAKLQKGVAAIYQNEWIEPVLCHIGKHERVEGLAKGALVVGAAPAVNSDESAPAGLSEAEKCYVNSCLFDPNYLARPSDLNFLDCVAKMDVPDSKKARLIEYARTPMAQRKKVYEDLAYEHFKVGERVKNAEGPIDVDWANGLVDGLRSDYAFEDGVDFGAGSTARTLFLMCVLDKAVADLRGMPRSAERNIEANSIIGVMKALNDARLS